MDKTIEIKDWYISNFGEFEKRLNGGSESSIHKKRKEALSSFSKLDFPTIKDEEWKYTSITALLKHNFVPDYEKKTVSKELIRSLLFDEMKYSLIVFVNGRYSAENSVQLNLPEGVIVGSIAEKIKNKKILLVDDVFTTGATVNECARVLAKNQAAGVDVFTFARAID